MIMKVPIAGKFTINGGDSAFADRQKQLFDQLSQAEKKCNKNHSSVIQLNDLETCSFSHTPPPSKRRRSETRQFRGKESIFKRPALPSPFTDRSVPDHRKNPHKWMKYSLDDVAIDDMSDKTNTTAALSFLNELKARKLRENSTKSNAMMDIECLEKNSSHLGIDSSSSATQIIFKKPLNKIKTDKSTDVIVDNNEKASFRGSKIILPEYIIGQKPNVKLRKEKRKLEKIDRHKQLKLDHLEEFDDGNDVE